MQRQFTSGSRQAPDPFDQFLEENNFYRKHTARDASCLFRVISEQMYDTQLHHMAIREKCVTYMRKHRKYFDYLVDRDFDEYLDDMSKTKTYGTLLELQAAGYMFERNVFLFQPFNLGNYYNEYRSNFEEVFRVFYTPERHFDSVFTSDYIQEAAICQSICYEILYKDLFKLPDVTFAVEQMLHGPNFDSMEYRTETNEEGYSIRIYLSDGRSFELDLPHNTNCILENYKLCHFHYINFPRYADDLQRELKIANCEDYEKNSMLIQRTAESFLPNKYVSCVRQLLQEGITPFPYKVAKALDPNMYRNIEFDSWNEMRKESKLQNWYHGDTNFKLIRYSTRRVRKIFQVGAKCHVKLRKSEQDLYTCHIQEIAVDEGQCIVFVEQLGEKRLVPYENLTPLPPDQFKPWTVPYRLQRHMQKVSSVRFTRHYNYRFKCNTSNENHEHNEFACGSISDYDTGSNNYIDDDPKKVIREQNNQLCTSPAQYFKLKQYAHLEDFRTHVEYCTMPLTVSHTGRENDGQKLSNQQGTVESSENSRTPSRSSTTMNRGAAVASGQNKSNANSAASNVDDQLGSAQTFGLLQMDNYDMDHYNYANGGPLYMPELQSFYPMYPYATPNGLVEDYYGYCAYDGGISPGAAFMPAVNGMNGFYYLCNNAVVPSGTTYFNGANPYFPPPPPPPLSQALSVQQPQTSPVLTSANPTNPSYYPNTHLANSIGGSQSTQTGTPPSTTVHPPASNAPNQLRPSNRSAQNTPKNTPLSGRINYDAKKSIKANGNDLPTDVATLRYFYNLGLDYYQKQKPVGTEQTPAESNNDQENSSSDKQNIKLDENANQVSNANAKLDGNNQVNSLETNSSNTSEATHQLASQANKNNGGNKTSNRRYTSRSFSGKERHMPQRNNSNYSGGGHHQQQQQNYSQRNQPNYNKYSSASNASNTVRVQQQQQHHHQLHPPNFYHSGVMDQQSRQISPSVGFNEATIRSNSAESQNCRTPTTNNSNSNNPNANNSEPTQEGGSNVGHLPMSMQPTASGVYIPIPLTTGPPPAPPYGIFAPHHTSGTPQAPGVGIHPSYMPSAPPQFIAHCNLPPPANIHGTLNTAGTGSDNTENASSSEMGTHNAGVGGGAGIIGMGSPGGMQFQCPNYPPPPMPFYYATTGVNSASGSGSASGTVTTAANSVHLVPPFAHHQVAGSTLSNQTALTSPHATMGTQGFYCLQPPPPAIQPAPQQMPQVVTQSPSAQSNRNSNPINLSKDNNPNDSRNELVATNND